METNIFNGATSRLNFFLGMILHGLLIVGLGWLITYLYSLNPSNGFVEYIFLPVLSIIGLLVMVSLISLVIRRMNDIKMARWKLILIFIPIINIFFSLYILLSPEIDKNDQDSY